MITARIVEAPLQTKISVLASIPVLSVFRFSRSLLNNEKKDSATTFHNNIPQQHDCYDFLGGSCSVPERLTV
jgi:hypothetical protein